MLKKQKLSRHELTVLVKKVRSAVCCFPFSAAQHERRRSGDFLWRTGLSPYVCLEPVVQVKANQKGGATKKVFRRI